MAWAVVVILVGAAVVLSTAYFRRYALTRPPLGTINLGDVVFMVAGIVVVPYLYLGLPGWLVGGLLGLSTLSVLYVLAEPVVAAPLVRWALAGGLVAADVLLAWQAGTGSRAFLFVNNVVLVTVVVGVTNLWAQGGLRARDLAILAGAIAVYDLIATGFLPLTTDLIERLAGLPFVPVAAWPAGPDRWLGIGLGDLLLAALGPLTLRKAYGRTPGAVAMAVALAAVVVVMVLAANWAALPNTFPTMVVLGPLLILQQQVWAHRCCAERSTARYLAEESLPAVA